ncbi:MAG: hypothetical protein JW913_01420 [Chitinispirillaceae bacterium]|nr:hypothetical protein [Chitinispirillaceae bacterium]
MKESSWEASRRKVKKKAFLLVFLLITALALATVLFLNNRDLIGPFGSRRSPETKEHAAEAMPMQTESAVPSPAPSVSPVSVSNDSQPVLPQGFTGSPAAKLPLPSIGDAPETIKTAAPDHPESFSIEFPSFPCRTESRKDVVIYLSLELFFSDIEKRAAILLRRNDIKVMVLRTVRDKELSGMKIGKLETQLLQDINKLFDHPDITAVKIRNIQVEKAFKK